MTTAEMLAELREVLADEIPTYGFSDVRALAYLNEGQEKFCEDTGFFTDARTFTVPTIAGTVAYALDSRIIRVIDVHLNGQPLQKLHGTRAGATAPVPTCWQTSHETGVLTVWPIPDTAVSLDITAWRYPLADLRATAAAGKPIVNPEIPKRMHRACIEWAAYKCYGHHDIELQGSDAALKHRTAYRQYVLEGRALKRNYDAEQIEVGPNPCYQVE